MALKISVSVDGFVDGPNGEVDWLFKSLDEDAMAWIVEILWLAVGHSMGSVTDRDMAAYWLTSTKLFAAPMNKLPEVVFSKSPPETAWTDTTVVQGNLAKAIAGLKQQPGTDTLAPGGARFAQSLSQCGLIDAYRLLVHPVALGSGLSLCPTLSAPIALQLVSTRACGAGAVAHV